MNVNMLLQRVSNQISRQIAVKYSSSIGMYPVIEYPKCGGTWLCRMLSQSLMVPFAQYSRLPVAMPCVMHGHWKYNRKLENVTYLMRDGRDVMVSFYFHFTRQIDNPNQANKNIQINRMYDLLGKGADLTDIRTHLPRFLEFLIANPHGAKQNWREHNLQWMNRPNVRYIKYEELRGDCVRAMNKLVSSLGREIDQEQIERAVEHYSMKRMTGRKPGDEDKDSFIRKGVVGDWKNHFSLESAQVFNDFAGDVLVELGYEPDDSWINRCGGPEHTGV